MLAGDMARKKPSPAALKQIADNLKFIRDYAGLSQAEMAATIGVHVGTYTRYEQQRSKAKHETLIKVAERFGYESSDQITRPGLPPPAKVHKVVSALEFEIGGIKVVGDFRRADGGMLDAKMRGELIRRLLGD